MTNTKFSEIAKPRLDRFRNFFPEENDPVLMVLKAHLLSEEILSEVIAANCIEPEALANIEIGYFLKVRLAKALASDKAAESIWEMAEALNSLRNVLAHKLESQNVTLKREKFIAIIERTRKAPIEGNDDQRLRHALQYFLGSISFLETYVKTGEIPPTWEDLNEK